jgi:hypothetical protein
LLQRLGRGYHSESLIGDLIEQCARGQTSWWAWREIMVAIFIVQAGRRQSSQWLRVTRAFWWCLTEVAVMLSVTLIADQSKNWHTIKDRFSPTVIVTLMVLFLIAFIGLRSLILIHRRERKRAAIHSLMALFVTMTLGLGTLTWAATANHAKGQLSPHEQSTIAGPPISRPPL